jgi:FtsP/CotA-like multicopper oxidase with cupredoxin domain
MNGKNVMLIRKIGVPVLVLIFLTIFGVGISSAATIDVYLRVDVTTMTINGEVITLWGYSQCTNGAFTTCGVATVPGPTLSATAGDTLNIHVQNNLSGPFTEPTSVVIPGQPASLVPTWTDNTTGNRGADLTKRVRSFIAETAVGAIHTYTFTPVAAGTYLYQSGTHPAVQVQMGLYGTLIVRPAGAPNQAYGNPSTAFNAEVTLLFSEIDPELHYSIESGNYGTPQPAVPAPPVRGNRTSTVEYQPKYFLINGAPYSPGVLPIPAGTPGQRVLLRFLNAGLLEKTPTMQVPYMTVIAQDGNLLPYSKQQYSVLLPAGKTIDAIITTGGAGYIPVFDRSLNLTSGATSPGGMLRYLQVAAAQSTLTVTKLGLGNGTVNATSLPGGISCGTGGAVCSTSYNTGTVLKLTAVTGKRSHFVGWGGACAGNQPDCIVTISGNTAVTATFALNPDTVGVFRPTTGQFFLKYTNSAGFADAIMNFGMAGDVPIAGDWTGKSYDSIGVFRNGTFYLRNSNTSGVADITFAFGMPGDLPVVGDWTGKGYDSVGVFRNGTFYLRNSNDAGFADIIFALGIPGDIPIAGDWTGKGYDSVGVFRPSTGQLFLKNTNTTGFADIVLNYGLPGDQPIVGDWTGKGYDSIGVFRIGTFYLRNSNTPGFADIVFNFGDPGDDPIAGSWLP